MCGCLDVENIFFVCIITVSHLLIKLVMWISFKPNYCVCTVYMVLRPDYTNIFVGSINKLQMTQTQGFLQFLPSSPNVYKWNSKYRQYILISIICVILKSCIP